MVWNLSFFFLNLIFRSMVFETLNVMYWKRLPE